MNFKSINENVSNTLEKEQIRFFFQIEMFEGLMKCLYIHCHLLAVLLSVMFLSLGGLYNLYLHV